MEKKVYKPYPDGGSLRATQVKKLPSSPDYWGDIAINLKDQTNIRTEDGLTIVKLSGWKRVGSDGKTYLSISVNRFVPEQQGVAPSRGNSVSDMEDDIPF